MIGNGAGGRFVAGLRREGEAQEPSQRARDLFTEAALVKEVRRIQLRSVEGARDREFRPVRPPLSPRKPTN